MRCTKCVKSFHYLDHPTFARVTDLQYEGADTQTGSYTPTVQVHVLQQKGSNADDF